MKKITLIALFVSAFTLSACARGKQPVAFQNLPEMVKSAVLKNYSDSLVQYITWEKSIGKDEYEFLLQDGTKLEYYENGQLHKIKCINGIPDVLVPEPILRYVRGTFPNAVITEFKSESWSQKVELNNEMDLIFNRRGDFLRID